MTDNSQY